MGWSILYRIRSGCLIRRWLYRKIVEGIMLIMTSIISKIRRIVITLIEFFLYLSMYIYVYI